MKRIYFIPLFAIFFISQIFGNNNENTVGEIHFETLSSHILVKVKINGSKTDYNFILDTGGVTFIDKAVAQDLSLKQNGPMAKVNVLDLAGFQIENVFCFTTFDFHSLRKLGVPIQGIIGSNLLERFKVTFDFQANTISFSTDTASLIPPDNGLFFTFRNHPVNNAPIIKFKVNQKTIEGMIDTGQPYSIVLPFKDFENYKESDISGFIQSKGLMIKWPNTSPDFNYLAKLNSCEFNNQKIADMVCIFGEPPAMLSMPLIGMDLLSQYKIVINYPKDEMIWIPNPDSHFKNNIFSIGLNLNLSEEGDIFVEGVWQDSPADKQNIQVGDHIIAYNSKKLSSENLMNLIELMKDDQVKSISLEVKNQNGTRNLKLNKTMLF